MSIELRRAQRRRLKTQIKVLEEFKEHVRTEFSLRPAEDEVTGKLMELECSTYTSSSTSPDAEREPRLLRRPQDETPGFDTDTDVDGEADDSHTVVGDYQDHNIGRKHVLDGDGASALLSSPNSPEFSNSSHTSFNDNVYEQVPFESVLLPKRRKSFHLPTYDVRSPEDPRNRDEKQPVIIEAMAVDPQLLARCNSIRNGQMGMFHIMEVQSADMSNQTPITEIRHINTLADGNGSGSHVDNLEQLGSAEAQPLPEDYESEDPELMDDESSEEDLEIDEDMRDGYDVSKSFKCPVSPTDAVSFESAWAIGMSTPLGRAVMKFLEAQKLEQEREEREDRHAQGKKREQPRLSRRKSLNIEARVKGTAFEKELESNTSEDVVKTDDTSGGCWTPPPKSPKRMSTKQEDSVLADKMSSYHEFPRPTLSGSCPDTSSSDADDGYSIPDVRSIVGSSDQTLSILRDNRQGCTKTARHILLALIKQELSDGPEMYLSMLQQERDRLCHALQGVDSNIGRLKREIGYKRSVQRRYDRLKARETLHREVEYRTATYGPEAANAHYEYVRGRTPIMGMLAHKSAYGDEIRLGANAAPLSGGKASPLKHEDHNYEDELESNPWGVRTIATEKWEASDDENGWVDWNEHRDEDESHDEEETEWDEQLECQVDLGGADGMTSL
ncbi:hypothetical protein MKZ38_008083 [Zalerion maritima]|uniref:Uncharacterized protein n=1 Tax=Zalerion maritima TaxID=339359 RepID=A0AAD5WU04_9PEZI|nr:hypothetical protein MKZ38_008083 [Zalerion maritima]